MAEKVMKTSPSAPGMPGGAIGGMDKSKDLKKAYKNLFRYIDKYKASLIIAAVLSVLGAILNLIGPNRLSDITDLITQGLTSSIDLPAIVDIAVLLAVLYGLGFIFNYIQGYIMATLSQRITQDMRRDISRKINRLPLRYFDSVTTGDVLSRVTNDVDTVGQTMNQSFSTLVSSVAMLLGSMLMMFITNWVMAFAGILSALLGFAIMMAVIGKSQKYFAMQQEELGGINGHVEETYSGHGVVKAYNGEKQAIEEFHQRNDRLYLCAWKSQFLSGLMMPLMTFIGNLAYVVVCIVGAILAMQGSVSFGTIVAFMLCISGCSPSLCRIFPRQPAASRVWRRPASASLNSWRRKRWKMKAGKLPV